MDDRYKPFPPRWRNQLIPTSSTSAALAGLSTYTAIRPLGLLVRNLSWIAVSMFGPRILPTRSTSLEVPMAPGILNDFLTTLRREIVSFDELSVHRQRGDERVGFALLLLKDGYPRSFVKVRPTDQADALFRELEAIRAVAAFRPRRFELPGLIAFGEDLGWSFLALEPLAPVIHRTPSRPPIAEICAEIGAALSNLPKPGATPAHWLPMHGDFTPWNLREMQHHLFLFDWEQVGWGPPGSDATLYQLTSRQLRLSTRPEVAVHEEAKRFWHKQGRIPN